ncbi:ABC transporter substrate-binding protein [Microbacterium marinilacus]|uniref:Extracellular solute-binding protein n=1 Tax=Microbacterium marinilacus TaxID=415209 RepID=A0ABP7BA42_9MICO|nr:extracellular solute-binding protein [Microbacterium marinilacus]MBY0687266.1 extracellular solute-binding protein [Microbacterium marinilacus]
MKTRRTLAAAGALALAGGALAGCSAPAAQESDDVLTLWHYEGDNSAMGIAWAEAMEVFEEETGATVEFEERSFEQIRQTASQVLNSDEAPDLLEYNKGNATAGLLSSQGLLEPLDDAVAEYGWDDKLAPSLQTTARYDENGVMGSGSWYGVPTYGEYVQFFYNTEMFEQYGLEVPTTLEELEEVMQAFVDEGVTPLAEAAGEYPLGQLWYQLALSQADRQWVNDYQLYENPVDFSGPETAYATETVKDWVDRGFISGDATGLAAEDAGTGFINGTYPMFFSGSWWYGRFLDEAQDDWATFLFPGAEMSPGSSGNLWVVPAASGDKDLAYQFIEITLRPEIQALMGDNGGVPVAADAADLTNESSEELIANFNTLLDRDGLAFYPDWPTPTFYDELNAGLQGLVNGTLTPAETNEQLGADYDAGLPAGVR